MFFSKLAPVERRIVNPQTIQDPHGLAGFTSAEKIKPPTRGGVSSTIRICSFSALQGWEIYEKLNWLLSMQPCLKSKKWCIGFQSMKVWEYR